MQIISRQTAKAAGAVRYFTGRPCKREHLAERFVSTAHCVECQNENSLQWKHAHLDICTAEKRRWRARNRERVREVKRNYYASNPRERERQALRSKRWNDNNRDKILASSLRWRKANPERYRAGEAERTKRRQAQLRRCMPAWVDQQALRKFYELAQDLSKTTGVPHDVDHIVPLQGKLAWGLHVPANLQVIPASVNRSKGARFRWTDAWSALHHSL